MYAVRIHTEHCDTLDFLKEYKSFFVLERDASRAHYQGIVEYPRQPASLRALIKKKCPRAVGNAGYSVKQLTETPERYVQYLCKGTHNTYPELVLNTMDVTNIVEKHMLYWKEHALLKETSTKKKKSVASDVQKEFPWAELTFNCVTQSVLDYLISHDRPINMNYIQGLVLLILAKNDSKYRTQLVASICRKNNLLL